MKKIIFMLFFSMLAFYGIAKEEMNTKTYEGTEKIDFLIEKSCTDIVFMQSVSYVPIGWYYKADSIPTVEYRSQDYQDDAIVEVDKGKRYYTMGNGTGDTYIMTAKTLNAPPDFPNISSIGWRKWIATTKLIVKLHDGSNVLCIIKDGLGNEWYWQRIGINNN